VPADAQPAAAENTLQQLRRRSTSALSTKLASAGLAGNLGAAPPQPPPAKQQGSKHSSSGGSSNGSDGSARRPPPAAAAPQGEPSVHAPFWDQPLIMEYIAAQQPGSGGGGGAKAGATGSLPGEPRIRTVKMRGAGGGTQHTGLRPRLRV
jgi:hypothetical protein